MDRRLIDALRLRRVDVISAFEVGMVPGSDSDHLAYATQHGRVLYRYNVADFCWIHGEWLKRCESHSGILLAHQQRYSVGEQLRGLLHVISQSSSSEFQNRLEFLGSWM
jgi:hypothetical protein